MVAQLLMNKLPHTARIGFVVVNVLFWFVFAAGPPADAV